ncbi:MAG: hypothetical protein C4527_21140 [Candidatus Omnitrophota bacterium]|jgi:hypothetical protein|nr:MAG: hypothetical protein C4527_21140 [Candidatus Omnitrophota bacterium]
MVEDVLGRQMTRKIWTGNFEKAMPISFQGFDLSAILPAVFYMFRFGKRRGKGKFIQVFGGTEGTLNERRRNATIEKIAAHLSSIPSLRGFNGEIEQAILGDLLLCFCLENKNRNSGRTEQIQRVAPVHYMASWIDLPDKVVNLRYVPEMIVAMLADQKGEHVQLNKDDDRTWFAVGRGFENNVLMHAFHQGITIRGELASRTSDRFAEDDHVGIDQLLMIRLAQQIGEAPDKLRDREGENISNQRPIAEKAARHFSEDIRRFIRSYADQIPRQTLVDMLESCVAIGLTTILTSMCEILFEWIKTGAIPILREQHSVPLFVDCSHGMDKKLRSLTEESFDDFCRRFEKLPVILMSLRLLDYVAIYDRNLSNLPISTKPYATDRLNLLGDLFHERREESKAIFYDFDRKSAELFEKLKEEYPEITEILGNYSTYPNHVLRLAEALTVLQGRENTQTNLLKCLNSTLSINQPNGIAVIRKTTQRQAHTGRKTRDARSLVFTDSVLDYLVHVHLLPSGNSHQFRSLSLKEFIHKIRERYGFCIDEAPPGMTISNELLQTNRAILERRMRDLGLLAGVNDAESMKRLQPRFKRAENNDHDIA